MFKGLGPEKILPQVLDDLKETLAADLVSAAVYGSAAGRDFQPGLSDVNLLVVVKPAGLNRLGGLAIKAAGWAKKRIAPPLVVSEEEIESSLDAFPLEFLNIKSQYRLLHGPDPLADLVIDRDDLRLQCERELRGKLLLLREALLSSGGREMALFETALTSIKAFVAIFRGVLHLLGREAGPFDGRQVLAEASRSLNLEDGAVLAEIWALRGERRPPRGRLRGLFGRYLGVIAAAARAVDDLKSREEGA